MNPPRVSLRCSTRHRPAWSVCTLLLLAAAMHAADPAPSTSAAPTDGADVPLPAGIELQVFEERDGDIVAERYTWFTAPDPLPPGWVARRGKVRHGEHLVRNWKGELRDRFHHRFGVLTRWERLAPTGQPAFVSEGPMEDFDDGYGVYLLEGTARWFDETGQPEVENEFRDGRPARVALFHSEGKPRNLFLFDAAATPPRARCELTIFDEAGQPVERGWLECAEAPRRWVNPSLFFVPNPAEYLREGEWQFFDSDGRIRRTVRYRAGEELPDSPAPVSPNSEQPPPPTP